jgi:hypothetical protein
VTTFKKITTGVLAAATLTAVASPAEAQWRHRRGGDRTALAIGAGALGLAVGAAIASNDRGWRGDRWGRGWRGDRWDRGWRGDRWGRGWDGYHGRPYAYGYGRPYGWDRGWRGGWRQRCWTDRVWDDWRGRWRRVRVCDRF